MNTGETIREILEKDHVSQVDLAKRLDTSKQNVHNYLIGEGGTVETFERILNALGYDLKVVKR